MRIELRHDLPCTPEQFWEAFFDPDVTERMYTEAIGATSVEILDQSGDLDSTLARRLEWTLPVDAPGPIKKLVGEETTSVEAGTYHDGTWTYTVEPDAPVKIQMKGTMTAEPTAEGCVRVFDLDVKVKMIGLGKVFEKFAESQARDAQEKTATFLRGHFA